MQLVPKGTKGAIPLIEALRILGDSSMGRTFPKKKRIGRDEFGRFVGGKK